MTDTCIKCGERQAAPGEFGQRWAACAFEVASQSVFGGTNYD